MPGCLRCGGESLAIVVNRGRNGYHRQRRELGLLAGGKGGGRPIHQRCICKEFVRIKELDVEKRLNHLPGAISNPISNYSTNDNADSLKHQKRAPQIRRCNLANVQRSSC
jgi:hypothetical protein